MNVDKAKSNPITQEIIKKRPRSEEENDQLHTVGYRVHKSAFKISESLLQDAVKNSKGATEIFNYNENQKNDFKRLEAPMDRRKCTEATKNFLSSLNKFVEENISSTLTPSKWNVIHSKAGCQDQAPHCDFDPDIHLGRVSDAQMPLSVIVVLMPGTRLNIWPNSIRLACLSGRVLKKMDQIPCRVLALDAGDVLVFRGDFIHAGSSYKKDNYRLHTFLDSEAVPRESDTTWTVHQDGEPPLKKIILPINYEK